MQTFSDKLVKNETKNTDDVLEALNKLNESIGCLAIIKNFNNNSARNKNINSNSRNRNQNTFQKIDH